jgi:hypothetical protein
MLAKLGALLGDQPAYPLLSKEWFVLVIRACIAMAPATVGHICPGMTCPIRPHRQRVLWRLRVLRHGRAELYRHAHSQGRVRSSLDRLTGLTWILCFCGWTTPDQPAHDAAWRVFEEHAPPIFRDESTEGENTR